MQFNSHASNLDLYSDFRDWCAIDLTDTTTVTTATFARWANIALDKVTAQIMRADTTWQWDDVNNTDLPIATTTLVAEQQDYSIASTHLKILKVRVKDASGNYQVLEPVDRRDLTNSELTATSGFPRKYDKVGNSIFLYPKPQSGMVTTSAGLEVQFQRGASYFVAGDTTKEPGFASQFHTLVSLYAAQRYCQQNDLEGRLKNISAEIERMSDNLLEFYSSRDADKKVSLSPRTEDYGASALHG